jgi:trans-2,3-dihydro-3-hydroxyanthranilate isomerase
MGHEFATVDVFTDRRFAGNPLAVLPDARGLSDAAMQAIAAEFGYAETSFVLPPDDPANHARVRIFTPVEEMPFAGHPNVGTGFVLGRQGALFGAPLPDRLRFEEPAGIVAVDLEREEGRVVGAAVRAPRALAAAAGPDGAAVARLAGLAAFDLLEPPVFASIGTEFLLARVGPDALGRARPELEAFAQAASAWGKPFLALYLWAGEPPAVSARMFAPLTGVTEDAATGSAAGALGAFLFARRGTLTLAIAQGAAIGRPSAIHVMSDGEGTSIAGRCIPVMKGRLEAE